MRNVSPIYDLPNTPAVGDCIMAGRALISDPGFQGKPVPLFRAKPTLADSILTPSDALGRIGERDKRIEDVEGLLKR